MIDIKKRWTSIVLIVALVFMFNGLRETIAFDDGEHTLQDADVTIVGNMISAYSYAGSATNIIIPSTLWGADIKVIGTSVFANKGLTSVQLPDTLEVIEMGGFAVNSLTSVVLPDKLTTLGKHAFFRNAINKITFGSNLYEIGDNAFMENAFTKLTIPKL